jgi:4-hydroxy-tetrahydrodipicolinate reductase
MAMSAAQPLRIAVAGASGRMGHMLIDAVNATSDCVLSGTLDLGLDIRKGLQGAQVLIDFTRPEGTLAHLDACREFGVKAVIGTTGFDEAHKARIAEHAGHLAIVMSPNMSVGVNVALQLIAMASRALAGAYDIEVLEAHHRHKVDAPSGTALKMGEVIAQATGTTLADVAVLSREGVTGERKPGTIGFAAVRGGSIVGDHTVMYCGDHDRIEITHRASSRAIYVEGSLRAARFVAGKANGLYGMEHVLGFAG